MDLHYLKKIIRLIEQSSVDEVEIDEEGTKIRIAKNRAIDMPHGAMIHPIYQHMPPTPQGVTAPAATPAPAVAAPAPTPAPAVSNHHEVRSPIVGTFYRAPAPDADPYVEVGQVVEKGTVLCIIEAMKLMNEIEADASGRIVKCLVDNAKPVEYNQPLFLIEPV